MNDKSREGVSESPSVVIDGFESVLIFIDDLVFILDEDANILFVNAAVERRLDISAEDVIGEHVFTVHPADRNDEVELIMRQVADGKLDTCQIPLQTSSGEVVEVETRITRGIWKGRHAYLGITRDMSERSRMERELRDSKDTLKALSDASFEAIFLSEKGVCVGQNLTAEKMFGYTQEEAMGRKGTEWIAVQCRDRAREKILDGNENPYESLGLRKDGTTFPVEIQGRMIDFGGKVLRITALRDITVRKRVETEREYTEKRNRGLVSAVPDLLFTIKTDGTFVDCEAPAKDQLVFRPEQFLGKKANEFLPREITNKMMKCIRDAQETQEVARFEYSMAQTDKVRDYEARIVTLDEEHVLAIIRDITESKRLSRLESKAQRLELAGSIAGQVAHDFNNLLGPAMGYPRLIRNMLGDNHEANRLLESIEESTVRIAEINQQLLTLARRGHYETTTINLNHLVDQIVDGLEELPAKVRIKRHLEKDLLPIRGGNAQLARVLMNLVQNAVDAVDESGTIVIKTRNTYIEEQETHFVTIPSGEYVRLSVSDDGCGIPDDVRERVFEPFFSTKAVDRRRGSGLGLSVVGGVISDHSGYIDFESRAGEGSTFEIFIPIDRVPLEKQETTEAVGGDEVILVADDDNIQRDLYERILASLGYSVETVASGEDALVHLGSRGADLLVLDMVMPPGMDGTETFIKARELNPEQRAILVSGFSESGRVLEAQEAGAGEFVRKPLTIQCLAVAIRRELDRKQ